MKVIFTLLGIIFCIKLLFEWIIRITGKCPIDHDTIARQGAGKCSKCKEEF